MIFIGGYTASGKTTLSKMLRHDGYLSIDVKEIPGFIELINKNEYRLGREISNNVLTAHKLIVEEIKDKYTSNNHKDIVISGLRSIENINLLLRLLSQESKLRDLIKNLQIVYINSEMEILMKRFQEREEDNKNNFEDSIKRDNLSGIKTIEANADIIIDNNSSIEETYTKLISKLEKTL